MPRRINTLNGDSTSQLDLDQIAKSIADHVLQEYDSREIANLEQDEIDAKLFTMMKVLEEKIDTHIVVRIEEEFTKQLGTEKKNWWTEE